MRDEFAPEPCRSLFASARVHGNALKRARRKLEALPPTRCAARSARSV